MASFISTKKNLLNLPEIITSESGYLINEYKDLSLIVNGLFSIDNKNLKKENNLRCADVIISYDEDTHYAELESFFRATKNDSNLNIQACKTSTCCSTQSVTLLMGSESDNISVMYVNEEIGEQMIAPTWLPSSFPHTVELTVY